MASTNFRCSIPCLCVQSCQSSVSSHVTSIAIASKKRVKFTSKSRTLAPGALHPNTSHARPEDQCSPPFLLPLSFWFTAAFVLFACVVCSMQPEVKSEGYFFEAIEATRLRRRVCQRLPQHPVTLGRPRVGARSVAVVRLVEPGEGY